MPDGYIGFDDLDWRKHLKYHLDEKLSGHLHLERPGTRKMVEVIGRIIRGELTEDDFEWDSEFKELKRLMILCMSLDRERGQHFAGNPMPKDEPVMVPLTRYDMEILFTSIQDRIEERMMDVVDALERPERLGSILDVREIPDEEAEKEMLELFKQEGNLFYTDVERHLNIPLSQVIGVVETLIKKGVLEDDDAETKPARLKSIAENEEARGEENDEDDNTGT